MEAAETTSGVNIFGLEHRRKGSPNISDHICSLFHWLFIL
jgi:hypothetical protein